MAIAVFAVVVYLITAGPDVAGPEIDGPEIDGPEVDGSEVDRPDNELRPSTGLSPPLPGLRSDHGQNLAVRRDDTIFVVDLETGEQTELTLDQPAVRGGLASADGHLAYVGETNAFLIAVDGSAVLNLGAADTVIDATNPSAIWVGEHLSTDRTSWREIDSNGTVIRSTITAIPLDFAQPDLRWGHQNHMLRLTEDEARPWRIVGQGAPVAAGQNDLILAVCDAEFRCGRRWFERQSGVDQGPLLADVADTLPVRSDGVLSPGARYLAVSKEPGFGVTLISVATGRDLHNDCGDVKTIRWSTDDAVLACLAQDGVVVHDLELGSRLLVDSLPEQEYSFTFVAN